MAAEIHSRPQSARPVLLNKIEGHQDAVNAAVLIPKEDGVITVGEDRTIRVWLKRDSGQYWPSIYHTVSSPCSSMSYHHDSKRIFIGQDNGAVVEFEISEDFNKITFVKTYPAHQSRVSAIVYCPESLTAGAFRFDHDTKHAFVGDFSGQITLLKLDQNTYSVITTLKGHEGSVGSLYWDPAQRLLFSGASDHSVIMWDIGGRKGRTLLLQGHHDRVQSLCYLQLTRQLVSCAADGGITVWNMDVSREEAPQWLESDCCQKCEQPFFWNLKQMWDTKTIGLRQLPKTGCAVLTMCFPFPSRTSLATFHEGKHNIAHMNMDSSRGLMVTCGSDRVVKVCELDIIFNFEKAYFILDEFLIGGEVQETSKLSVSKCIEESDLMQEVSPGMKDTLLKVISFRQ
ncbi:UNVERIFIED_CONTAM: hypothetical protein FKN15_051256 [Acipenser sinensis]